MDFARKKPLPELREDTRTQIARIIDAWEHALATYKGDFLFGALHHRRLHVCAGGVALSRPMAWTCRRVRGYMDRVWALPAMQEWRAVAKRKSKPGLPAAMP